MLLLLRRFNFLRALGSAGMFWIGERFIIGVFDSALKPVAYSVTGSDAIRILLLYVIVLGNYAFLVGICAVWYFWRSKGGLSQGVFLGVIGAITMNGLIIVENGLRGMFGFPVHLPLFDLGAWLVTIVTFALFGALAAIFQSNRPRAYAADEHLRGGALHDKDRILREIE